MSARDDLADWEDRTDALLATLEAERSPDLARITEERYPRVYPFVKETSR